MPFKSVQIKASSDPYIVNIPLFNSLFHQKHLQLLQKKIPSCFQPMKDAFGEATGIKAINHINSVALCFKYRGYILLALNLKHQALYGPLNTHQVVTLHYKVYKNKTYFSNASKVVLVVTIGRYNTFTSSIYRFIKIL